MSSFLHTFLVQEAVKMLSGMLSQGGKSLNKDRRAKLTLMAALGAARCVAGDYDGASEVAQHVRAFLNNSF